MLKVIIFFCSFVMILSAWPSNILAAEVEVNEFTLSMLGKSAAEIKEIMAEVRPKEKKGSRKKGSKKRKTKKPQKSLQAVIAKINMRHSVAAIGYSRKIARRVADRPYLFDVYRRKESLAAIGRQEIYIDSLVASRRSNSLSLPPALQKNFVIFSMAADVHVRDKLSLLLAMAARGRSSGNTIGLMHVPLAAIKGLRVKRPSDPFQNINAGATIFKSKLNKFGGREDLAVAAYSFGDKAVSRGGIQSLEVWKYVQDILQKRDQYDEQLRSNSV